MSTTALAHPNIALIKYWGKRDIERNLPAVGSISVTLDALYTRMSLETGASLAADRLLLNGQPAPSLLPRLTACLDAVLGTDRPRLSIQSESNFPVAAGLASSASAFAACVVAADALDGGGRSRDLLCNLAGRSSGSAARSLFGGFAELCNRDERVDVTTLLSPGEWPIDVVVAVTSESRKATGSGEAMEISRQTSPFYTRWLDEQEQDLDVARNAIAARDFAALGRIAEHNCLKMHSVMWTSRPPMVYWTSATVACLETIRDLAAGGVPVFFTIDAGPQVKALCLPEATETVAQALGETPGVKRILRSKLGEGARVLEAG